MSKIKDLKAKYPDLVLDIIDALSKLDPSGKNKYLEFILIHSIDYIRKVYMSGQALAETHEELLTMVKDFDKYAALNILENKDIYSYKSLDDLYKVLQEAKKVYDDKMMKERESIVLFENDVCLLIKPLTKRTSNIYGKQTEWCTSATSSTNRFDEYSSHGALIYFIWKTPPEGLPEKWNKLAFNKKNSSEHGKIWDAKDKELVAIDTVRLMNYVPQEIFVYVDTEFELNLPNTSLRINDAGDVLCSVTNLDDQKKFVAKKHFQSFTTPRKLVFDEEALTIVDPTTEEEQEDWWRNLRDASGSIQYNYNADTSALRTEMRSYANPVISGVMKRWLANQNAPVIENNEQVMGMDIAAEAEPDVPTQRAAMPPVRDEEEDLPF